MTQDISNLVSFTIGAAATGVFTIWNTVIASRIDREKRIRSETLEYLSEIHHSLNGLWDYVRKIRRGTLEGKLFGKIDLDEVPPFPSSEISHLYFLIGLYLREKLEEFRHCDEGIDLLIKQFAEYERNLSNGGSSTDESDRVNHFAAKVCDQIRVFQRSITEDSRLKFFEESDLGYIRMLFLQLARVLVFFLACVGAVQIWRFLV